MAVARAFAEVRLPQLGKVRAASVRVRQPTGRHETATILLHSRTIAKRIRKDAPVEIRWGRGGEAATFVGYVNRVKSKKVGAATHVTVTCVGSTSSFSNTRNRAWRGSIESVVREVARLNRHTALIEPSKFDLSLNQAGRSDWELLRDLADRTGRILYARGMLVVLCSRDYWMKDRASAPRLRDATLEVDETAFDPRRPGTITTQGMDRSGKVFTSQPVGGSKTVRAVSGGIVARTSAELKEAADAKRELARYSLQATVEARGNARVSQGKPVYVGHKDPRYTGYWLVDEVVHVVERGTYRMKVQVLADGQAGIVRDRPPIGVVPVMREPVVLPVLAPVAAVLDPESPEPSDLDAFDDALEDPDDLLLDVADTVQDTWGFEAVDLGLSDDDDDPDFAPSAAAEAPVPAEGTTSIETRAGNDDVEVDDTSVTLELDEGALLSNIDMGGPDGGSTTITLED